MGFLNFKRLSLKMRFICSFVFVIIITITILSLANHFRWNHNYLRYIRDEGLILTQTLAQGSIDPIIRNDFYTLNEFVTNLIKKKNIAYVVITDRHDRILAQNPGALNNLPLEINNKVKENISSYLVQKYYNPVLKTKINDISMPILIDSKKWGTVRVGFSLEHMRAEIARNVFVVISTGLISVFIGIVVALILSRFITDPIKKFSNSLQMVAAGDLEKEIRTDTTDEFSILAKSFNQMARSLRKSKEELRKAYQRLVEKEMMAALGELTARIAHEIKNPLGIIKGSAQILVDETESPEVKIEVGGYIIEEVNRLNNKVLDLLNYARPNPPSLQEVDINEVLEERIQFWESQKAGQHKIKIIRKFSSNIPALLLDKEQLRQVILNMIINACEAMPEGGRIKITTNLVCRKDTNRSGEKGDRENANSFLDNGYVEIKFEDTGIGIAKKDLHKIFDPFFTTKKNGTGIGLSTVSRILENHKGMIQVESTDGKGTKFVVLFPLKQALS